MDGPHPRGERSQPLLDSLEAELSLSELFQERTEEEENPVLSEPRATVARRVRHEPVNANLAGLFAEPKEMAMDAFDGDNAENLLGDLYGKEDVEMGVDEDDDDDDGDNDNDDGGDDEGDIGAPLIAASAASPVFGAAAAQG